ESPERPSHMSAWSKARLGWVHVEDVHAAQEIALHPIETSHEAYRIRISNTQSYLVSSRARMGFDAKLPGEGLEVLLINDTAIAGGLPSNTVNADYDAMGVKLVEADGSQSLRNPNFRGGAGDLFPANSGPRDFDASTNPAAIGSIAICGIPDSQD